VVGSPTEPAYADGLVRYAASLGLADAVDFVSGISDDELAAHYRFADVLVMLSEHEGFGVPLVEAMGHGLPVVAFDAGAVDEVLGWRRAAARGPGSRVGWPRRSRESSRTHGCETGPPLRFAAGPGRFAGGTLGRP
jgi:glycogen synthase